VSYRSRFASEKTDEFFHAILALESLEDCYRFFEDLCTASELVAMAQRVQVAKMLLEEYTYQDIATLTGVSSATISRVKRSLKYGADGYTRILKKLEEQKEPDNK
jgi:TrpR-related protein YerC/YecD